MEFVDVVMKRRAVRRFEEGGVEREVIERIARLAQRTPVGRVQPGPAAGRRHGARAAARGRPDLRRGVLRRRLRAVDQRVRRAVHPVRVGETIYHRRYQEADKVQDDGTEIEWPVPYWFVDVGGDDAERSCWRP